jgi:molecular chaperone IbpA
MLRAAQIDQQSANYPPFNIEQIGDDQYVLQLAVAGFRENELSLSLHNSVLTVTGKKAKPEGQTNYLHRGLSFRDFERTFTLAEHVQVIFADLQDGMLTINLERQVPESAKPKTIPIGSPTVASIAKATPDALASPTPNPTVLAASAKPRKVA